MHRSAVAYTAASGVERPDYNSDEEVYNTARAVDEAGGVLYDADGNQVIAGNADNRKVCRLVLLAGLAAALM